MKDKVRIGYWNRTCKTPLYFPGDSHLILTAPSGGGKGRDVLIGALLEKRSSVLTIDPKGELCAVTSRARSKMGKVFALNPFNILPEYIGSVPHAGFNPLAVLDPRTKSFGADCDAIAEAIVFHEAGSEGSHWTDSARALVSGVVMALVKLRPPHERNLVRMYQLITGPEFFPFVRWVLKSRDMLIGGRLGRFAASKAEENRELMGILSTAITQCNFLGNDAIAESLNPRGHELRFSTLRQTPTTVYLILPTKYLSACAKWFRLVLVSAMTDLLREGNQGRVKVLALLDEFANLGALSIITQMMGIGRGYGVQLWPVLQDLNQLVKLYPKDWETFLGNAGAQLFFAPRDNFTARWISDKCGQAENAVPRLQHSAVEMWEQEGHEENPMGLGVHVDQIPRSLMLPHEVAYMGGDEMIVFGENLGGIILAGRKSYMKTWQYAGKFDPNPYHAGAKNSFWKW